MNRKNLLDFFVFFFFFIQIVSSVYLYTYWRHFGVDPFSFAGVQDVVFSASRFLVPFSMLALFLLVLNYFLPDAKYFETHEKKGAVFGIGLVLSSVFILAYVSKNFSVESPYWSGVLSVCMVMIKYSSNFMFNAFRKYKFTSSDHLFHFCIFLSVTGMVVSPAFALRDASFDEDNEFRSGGAYIGIEECEGCYYRLAGVLGDYVIGYDWYENTLTAIPINNISFIEYYPKD